MKAILTILIMSSLVCQAQDSTSAQLSRPGFDGTLPLFLALEGVGVIGYAMALDANRDHEPQFKNGAQFVVGVGIVLIASSAIITFREIDRRITRRRTNTYR